ncbi:MAG: elongation factor P [Patescibacteria group bacterium]
MLSLNQAKTGSKIIWRNAPHELLEANHLKVGRGGAKLVCKLRNLLTGAVVDYTFSGDEKLEVAEVRYRAAQFLYSQQDKAIFMTNDDFATIEIVLPSNQTPYLLEGSPVDLMLWQDKAFGVKLPNKVTLKVSYTEPGFKGNTQSSTLKPATLETGLEVMVPLFVSVGDLIVVSTETGKYDSRA